MEHRRIEQSLLNVARYESNNLPNGNRNERSYGYGCCRFFVHTRLSVANEKSSDQDTIGSMGPLFGVMGTLVELPTLAFSGRSPQPTDGADRLAALESPNLIPVSWKVPRYSRSSPEFYFSVAESSGDAMHSCGLQCGANDFAIPLPRLLIAGPPTLLAPIVCF